MDEVIAAAQKASIHEQILQLPDGYDSDALQLSGGQQQRIAIARMFLKTRRLFFWTSRRRVWMPLRQNRSNKVWIRSSKAVP